MPYCIIHKRPVFLFKSRYDKLREEALKSGNPAFHNKLYELLKIKYRQDPKEFETNWVRFNLIGVEAAENVWDLLYDYSCYCGHTYLSDMRDGVQQIKDSYDVISMPYPVGRVFALNYRIKPMSWSSILRIQKYNLQIAINTTRVERLFGDLSEFHIITKDFVLFCGKDVSLMGADSQFIWP